VRKRNRVFRWLTGVLCALSLASVTAAPVESLREQEIAQCLPGEIATWADGVDRPAIAKRLVFAYSHTDAPAWFNEQTVFSLVSSAVSAWSQCGISAGAELTSVARIAPVEAIRIQWNEAGSRGNFGLADLGQRTIWLGPAAFRLLRSRNPSYDSRQTLQMVISHEMGHMFGVMAHSRRCVDVTSYYDNGKGTQCLIRDGSKRPPGVEYRSVLPTACDIERCRAVNR
jgi:hypothetical protein